MTRSPLRPLAALAALALCAPTGAPAAAPAAAPDEARLLRQPDISRTQITFVHAGDLWIVGRDGGTAQRLTSGPGEELYPKFSPDGAWIAFSAEYSGTRQVWVMPAGGGTPRQLTWYPDVGPLPVRGGTDYRVLDWTPDGTSIVVRMNRLPYDDRSGRPYLVPFAGGMETPLAVPESGGGSLSPDGTRFVYTPIDADWRGWKRYRGGRAPDVWIYDLAKSASTQLTTFAGIDQHPAWIGDTVYFASDRTGTLNLYAMPAATDRESTAPTPVTTFTDFDVAWPSGGPDAVVFSQGGWIWRHDARDGSTTRVPIRIVDDTPDALPRIVKVADTVESADLAPDGARALFSARGEVFTVPAELGEARNVTRTPAAREHSARWSPDGRWIVYLSDATGEYELWLRREDGSGEARQLTGGDAVWMGAPVWSPDSKRLAWTDQDLRLRVVDVDSGEVTEVDRGTTSEIGELAWSPDSRWLVYTRADATIQTSLWLWQVGSPAPARLTGDDAAESTPVFDPEGRWLYFLSNRDYSGFTRSSLEENWLYTHATRVYAAALAADGPAILPERSDEVGAAPAAATPGKLRIDPTGFDARVVTLPIPAGDWGGLAASADRVFVLGSTREAPKPALHTWAIADRSLGVVAADVSGFVLARDGEKVLVRTAAGWAIGPAQPDAPLKPVPLDRVELRVDPQVERQQMYVDAWRILRDWFYDPEVHGGRERWDTVRARYAPLAAAATTAEDFTWVLHELAGEANAGHVYVERSHAGPPAVERKPGGLLGAEFAADPSGAFRFTRIYPGESWNPATRSPLTEPGVNVREGDYLLAVDGVPAKSTPNVYALLEGKGDRLVELLVNDRPTPAGARTVRVRTITSERPLRYLAWTAERRAMVDRLSGGRIGYVHLPNTAAEGNAALARWMPVIARKEALIVDDRWNGGGMIPDRLVETLARTPLNYWKVRGLPPTPTPLLSHRGPKAMLVNGLSSSGGDALPYYFRALHLGPLVGTRTWGGLIGLSGNPGLADGSALLVPTFRFLGTDGRWAVENEGVAPDVEVIDRPELVAAGRDPSLEKAVELLLAELAAHPVPPVVAPPAPREFR